MADMALDALVRERFPGSRGREGRIEAYLELNTLLRVEDTAESVRALRAALPQLLGEFQHDLEHATARDVVHACLRALSYFMHHRAMCGAFSEARSSFFLSEVVRLLFSTQDEATYKLCLRCLTMQNLDGERLRLLPRAVEGMVQAIINPFKSRPIELQALRGLHALLVKYPQQMAASSSLLGIWVKPITSRLRSSDGVTREQARLVLQEAARYQSSWSAETAERIQACVGEYVLPAMKTLADQNKHTEALHMWILTVSLMRRALVEDLTVLNSVLYVPENAMNHTDAAVRLMGLQAWSHLVDAFCATDLWLFKKSVVQLLVQPVVVTLEEETSHNIVHAAFLCWKKLVSAAIRSFNAQYHDAHTVEDAQHDALKWKRWLDEIVRVPVSTILSSRIRADSDGGVVTAVQSENGEITSFLNTVTSMWMTASTNGKEDEGNTRAEDGRPSIDIDSSPAADVPTSIDDDCDAREPVIGSNAIGLAFLLPDVFAMIQTCISISKAADASSILTKQRAEEVAKATWAGFCQRVWMLKARGDKPDKLRLRLARICLDFALDSSSNLPSTSNIGPQKDSTLLSIDWQVSLMSPLFMMAPARDVILALLSHPKSRTHQCVVDRLSALQASHPDCGSIVRRFFSPGPTTDRRLNMTLKENALASLVMYVILESAVAIDAKSNLSVPEMARSVDSLCQLCRLLVSTTGLTREEDLLTPVWRRILEFVNRCIKAANALVVSNKSSELDSHTWRGLVEVCMSAVEQDEDTELLVVVDATPNTATAVARNGEAISCAEDDGTLSCSVTGARKGKPIPGTPDVMSEAILVRGSHPAVELTAASSNSSGDPIESAVTAAEMQSEPGPQPSPENLTLTKDAKANSSRRSPRRDPLRQTADRPTQTTAKAGEEVHETMALAKAVARSPRERATPTAANSSSQGIYPALAGCAESISMVYRHFPLAFRPLFSFYKIKTIGDLSSTPAAKVKTFGIKEPIETVLRALKEYNSRQSRSPTSTASPNSPFRRRFVLSPSNRRSAATSASPTTPSRGLPSPRRSAMGKRPSRHVQLHSVSPSSIETPRRKRARRSLDELNNEADASNKSQSGEKTPEDAKLADRVTFCLPTGVGDATCIARPGEDSQNGDRQETLHGKHEEEETEDKTSLYMLKLLQHLHRSSYYVDRITAEVGSLQSDSSLRSDAPKMDAVLRHFREAHELVATLGQQLHVAAEASAQRQRKSLDRAEIVTKSVNS